MIYKSLCDYCKYYNEDNLIFDYDNDDDWGFHIYCEKSKCIICTQRDEKCDEYEDLFNTLGDKL